ncbi:hypothetical protein L596_021405 [Steinernema carpocapsae]|uniref:Uncharacterized protein n=1 Tax=Steinernema carpocapsae TaxID=34508 RepID=A0A4U5MIQ3_STECR|nr:hypothetical protein L596_021405 [Steinernema carpocapsae]
MQSMRVDALVKLIQVRINFRCSTTKVKKHKPGKVPKSGQQRLEDWIVPGDPRSGHLILLVHFTVKDVKVTFGQSEKLREAQISDVFSSKCSMSHC